MTTSVDPAANTASLFSLLSRLWRQISRRRRVQFSLLSVLMVLASFAEVLSISVMLPFLMALAAPEKILAYPLTKPLFAAWHIHQPVQVVAVLTIAFCLAVIIAGALRICLLRVSTYLSCATGADLSFDIYRRTLYQPYLVHVSRNTSEVIAGVTIKIDRVISLVLTPVLTLISSAIMLLAVAGILLAIDPLVSISVFLGFGISYGLVGFATHKRALVNSERYSQELNQTVKLLKEGLGGIRDILIDGSQPIYCEQYQHSDLRIRRAQASLLFVGQFPRYLIEALGMVLIALVAWALAQHKGGLLAALPILGALALGAQRLLPVLQQAYLSWSNINGSRAQLRDTLELLEQPLPEEAITKSDLESLPFEQNICLRHVSFRYSPDRPWVLRDINLTIRKGERIGFIGATGCGKSTLLDLIMGLLPATEGGIEIDGTQLTLTNQRAWQCQLAHVPQSIFLADRTVAENIAFGQPKHKINLERVREAAQRAQLSELIESWPQGYETMVGERGIRLSGGQRQRIGIARALYKNAQVIVFDEATSALDQTTEEAVMQAIDSLHNSLTILVIAHRLSTLRRCDRIIELNAGGIRRMGSYSEIIAHAS